MTIAAILKGKGHEVTYIGPNASLRDAADLLAAKRIGCVPVMEGDEVVGMLSERDIVRSIGTGEGDVLARPVRELMTNPVLTVTSDVAVITALSMMTRRRVRHLPVVEGGKMTGLVSIGDLVKYRIDHIEAEAAAMREYIQSA